jgi:hypothetical protein
MNDTKIKPNLCTRCGTNLSLNCEGYNKHDNTVKAGKVGRVYYTYCPECGQKRETNNL